MKVLKENEITSCDVDFTLVMWPEDYRTPGEGRIEFQYGPTKVYLTPHWANIDFLKYCSFRGDYIEVWSKHNWQWAEEVINKLGIKEYVDLCRSKPSRAIDDKQDLSSIVGDRVYFPFNEKLK